MTDISDELRRVADEWDVTPLYALADRVDNEMVELPRDANDEPILPGDTVYAPSGGKCTVTSLQLYGKEDPSWMASICGNVGSYISTGCELTHERPDSWERIADELDAKTSTCGHQGFVVVSRDEVADIAARIRRLAKKGASNGTD